MSHPFLDHVSDLYVDAGRLTARTSALHQAKIAGQDATQTICDLLNGAIDTNSPVADIGCGRGSTTLALAKWFGLRRLTALDASPQLISVAAQRFFAAGITATTVVGDFHHLPFCESTFDAIVAAFCLYHSPDPATVIGEFARCLRRFGVAVLVTKSADSYSELDQILAESGLDPEAASRPSLYSTFHTGNMRQLASSYLDIEEVQQQQHVFQFAGFDHLAAYLATTPRYPLGSDPASITARLRAWRPDFPVTITSTVSYLRGARR